MRLSSCSSFDPCHSPTYAPRPDAASRAEALFDALDADKDGTITEDEFKGGARALLRGGGHHGYGRHGRLDRALDRLFDRVDGDGDGALTKDELVAALSRRRGAPAAQPSQTEPATEPAAEPVCGPGAESTCGPANDVCETPADGLNDAPPVQGLVAPADATPVTVPVELAPADPSSEPSPAIEPADTPATPAVNGATVQAEVTTTGNATTFVLNFTFSLTAVQSYSQTSQLAVSAALRVVATAA